MTIFVLHNNLEVSAFNKDAETSQLTSSGQSLYALPDTALLKNGKPYFIPDYADPCLMELHLAIRISRLGRCISPRFAHRYWDAITVVPHFIAQPLLEEAQRHSLPWSCAMGFDGAVPVGEFIKKDSLPTSEDEYQTIDYHINMDEKTVLSATMSDLSARINAAIAHISRFFLLRNGDMILLGNFTTPIPIEIEHHIDAFLNEENVLSFNIK